MKIFAMCLMLCVALMLMAGCATSFPQGVIYTEVKLPVDATGVVADSPKVGSAECTSILGLVALGDSSIETAMKGAGIKKVTHVDWEAKNILGIIGKYKVVVYGE